MATGAALKKMAAICMMVLFSGMLQTMAAPGDDLTGAVSGVVGGLSGSLSGVVGGLAGDLPGGAAGGLGEDLPVGAVGGGSSLPGAVP